MKDYRHLRLTNRGGPGHPLDLLFSDARERPAGVRGPRNRVAVSYKIKVHDRSNLRRQQIAKKIASVLRQGQHERKT